MQRTLRMPKGWARYRITWCKSVGGRPPFHAEISRAMNEESGLIEWHVLGWRGQQRDKPELSMFFGQDFTDAVMVGEAYLGGEVVE